MTLLGPFSAVLVMVSAHTAAVDSLPAAGAPRDTVVQPADGSPVARPVAAASARAADDTTRPRRHAVEVSDAYAPRLAIHRWASYTMPPLFVGEYVLGQKMLNERADAVQGRGDGVNPNTRTAHQLVAGGIAALFGINTITGVWNLYETRHQEDGRTLRVLHSVLMLASDAGFVATGVVASNASHGTVDDARVHRNVALASMVPATVGAAMMWINQIRGH